MKAVVLTKTCSASELTLSEVPVPSIRPGWVLVKVKAFGINRSEIILRSSEADAPYIKLPRIPGIECAGEIADPSDSHFCKGQRVVALMGGMGRSFDGSYAEYTLLPVSHVFSVDTDLNWIELAAVPETFFTAYGSLFDCLQIVSGDILLIRGGTSALGLTAVQLAKSIGCTVLATTRDKNKLNFLKEIGVDIPLLDDGTLARQLHEIYPNGVNKVLELVGPATLQESMTFLSWHGIICSTGILGKKRVLEYFDPIKMIPNGVYLTSFFSNYPTQEKIDRIFTHIRQHHLKPIIGRIFPFSRIADAHILMEQNIANGKIVVYIEERQS
ncbi:zinc-binding dehydrogenase [Caldicellulosiruptoraceae bacterium PP1]